MLSEEHLYSIALRKCTLIGDVNFHKIISVIGSAKAVWETPKKELAKINGIGYKITQEIGNSEILKFAENELKFCEKNNIAIKLRHQKNYPDSLKECFDAPAIIYQKGNYNEQKIFLSLVGTRNITNYGKSFLEDFLQEISGKKIITVSGLALGTDSEVHHLSLKHNIPTIGVLAHGFQTLYPSKNKRLAEQIIENEGALITEFNYSQKPERENFIQRNRIIAGLSSATIIVETAFGGGSVSTATFANGYNRDVFALPGKITDVYSQGCNHLIYQNKASAISNIKDLLTELNIITSTEKMEELFPVKKIEPQLNADQKKIYDIVLQNPEIHLDTLFEKTNLTTQKILNIILELELSGRLKTLSGRKFVIS